MKKLILSVVAIVGLSLSASSQIEIYVDGDATSTDYAGGGTYTYYANAAADNEKKIRIYNQSGTTEMWLISRRRIAQPANWQDYLCWGHESDQFGGICIGAQGMDMELYQMNSNAVTVADGEHGVLAAHCETSSDAGTATYRYYVGTDQDPFQDSIDVVAIITPASVIEQQPELTVGVQPNPATDNITITAGGVNSASVQIVDVLGNIILNTTVSGTKSINVAEYRNGIYFVNVSAQGTRVSRKVIVRH
ncbi:MAG: T9SS type A sorting domain-containing protein [bacterium]|nr:T9SS type A sorting domain-containing protein [bacterium]